MCRFTAHSMQGRIKATEHSRTVMLVQKLLQNTKHLRSKAKSVANGTRFEVQSVSTIAPKNFCTSGFESQSLVAFAVSILWLKSKILSRMVSLRLFVRLLNLFLSRFSRVPALSCSRCWSEFEKIHERVCGLRIVRIKLVAIRWVFTCIRWSIVDAFTNKRTDRVITAHLLLSRNLMIVPLFGQSSQCWVLPVVEPHLASFKGGVQSMCKIGFVFTRVWKWNSREVVQGGWR